MPVSNCTGDDIAYIIDDPPAPPTQNLVLANSMVIGGGLLALTAARFCSFPLGLLGVALMLGGYLVARNARTRFRRPGTSLRRALEAGRVKPESLEKASRMQEALRAQAATEEVQLGPIPACKDCVVLGAGKVTNGPLAFDDNTTVTLCNADGSVVLARVEIGQTANSKVACTITHFPDVAAKTAVLQHQLDAPIGQVSIHDDEQSGGLLVELLPVNAPIVL